jgi:hypothetical protein
VAADATELTLSRNLEALLVTKLPMLLPHAERAAEALGTAVLSFEVVAVEVAEETDATDARLNGRSFRSPPVEAKTDGENEEGGGGDASSEAAEGAGDVVGLVLGLANGLVNVGSPMPPGVCLCATILLTPPRTPSTALKKFVEPTEKTLVIASRVGASCCSRLRSVRPSWRRRPMSDTMLGRSSQGCLEQGGVRSPSIEFLFTHFGSMISNRIGSVI